jgi:very-short-patch-repair endonuclease
MSIFLSHSSALEYWRKHRVMTEDNVGRPKKYSLPDKPPATESVRQTGLSLPVHIMISNPKARRISQVMKQHICTDEAPAGCFVKAAEGLWVSSPESCFIQMAGVLSLAKLIELGYEICGLYSIPTADDTDLPERGFYYRNPLTSVKKLNAFIARVPGIRGNQKAKRAIRYLLDNSASPMETKLSILLTLPYLLGGYGLIAPELNNRIIPSKTARKFTSKTSYSCDLFWPEYNLAVEYDSAQHHSGSEQINSDAKKKNSLTLMGITVITVTKQQLHNTVEFEKVAIILANCLGKRLKYKKSSFTTAHKELREQLF